MKFTLAWLREYLDLLEGLSKGLCDSNKIEDFYNFSKLCLVKDEKNYDKFDKAFNSFYEENKNIINQVEKKIPESWVLNELKKILNSGSMKLTQKRMLTK